MSLDRLADSQTVTIANGAALSTTPITFSQYAMMVLHMPPAWTAADIAFQVATTEDGTYQPLYHEDGTLLEISGPAVDSSFVAPARIAAAKFVKLWSQSGGVAVNQAAARNIEVTTKG